MAILVVLACLATLSPRVRADGSIRGAPADGVDASALQIRETLGNLLKSIEDEGRKAENFFKARQQWCSTSLRARELELISAEASDSQLKSDLNEHEAAVEEAEGTAQQIEADIDLVQHTIQQTTNMLQASGASFAQTGENTTQEDQELLTALLDNKRQTLASLQGELEAVLPALSQLQSNVAEAKRQIADRSETVESGKSFLTGLQDDCAKASRRADAQAASRVGEANAIEAAVQVLENLVAAPRRQQQVRVAAVQRGDEDMPLSFVQWSQNTISANDVLSLMSTRGRRVRQYSTEQSPSALEADEDVLRQRGPATTTAKPSEAEPKIRELLKQLRGDTGLASKQQQWCAKETERNQLQKRLAEDAVGRIDAEVSAHEDAEAQLTTELSQLQEQAKVYSAIESESKSATSRELQLIVAANKDHKLATRILSQAIAILTDLELSGGLNNRAKTAASVAVGALKPAKAQFDAQIQVSAHWDQEVASASKITIEKAEAAAKARKHESVNLELARDMHASKKAQGAQDREVSKNEVTAATDYLTELSRECQMDVYVQQDRQRTAQVRALEDAQKVLDGKRIQVNGDPYGLHSSLAPVQETPNMSPMERAAAEMGVAPE